MKQWQKRENQLPILEVSGTLAQEQRAVRSSQVVERRGLDSKRFGKNVRRVGVILTATAAVALIPGSALQTINDDTTMNESPRQMSQEELAVIQAVNDADKETRIQNDVQVRAKNCAKLTYFWGLVEIKNVKTQAPPVRVLNPIIYDRQHIGFERTTTANDTRPFAVVRVLGGASLSDQAGTFVMTSVSLVDKSLDQEFHFMNSAGEDHIARPYDPGITQEITSDLITEEVCIKHDEAGNIVSLQAKDTTAVGLDVSVGSQYAQYGNQFVSAS